jgi:hypothetical protein
MLLSLKSAKALVLDGFAGAGFGNPRSTKSNASGSNLKILPAFFFS